MNIPTFENVCKYEDANDSFYEAFEMLTELPWLGSFTAAWVAVSILSMVEKGEEEEKKVKIWMTLPKDFLIFDFCPVTLTVEVYKSDAVYNRGDFVTSDELNEKFVVHGWSSCEYHSQFPPELEVIEGGAEG